MVELLRMDNTFLYRYLTDSLYCRNCEQTSAYGSNFTRRNIMEKYRICVACASGMATSHLIMDQLKDLFKREKIAADITVTRVGDLGTDPDFDLIVTSTLL